MDEKKRENFEQARQTILAREEERLRLSNPEFLLDAQAQEQIDFSDWSEGRLYDTMAQVALEISRREKVSPVQIYSSGSGRCIPRDARSHQGDPEAREGAGRGLALRVAALNALLPGALAPTPTEGR